MDTSSRLRTLAYRLSRPMSTLRELSAPVSDLTDLANRYGSDKGTICGERHFYTRVYEPLFAPLRDKPLRILEIGLLYTHDTAQNNQGRNDGGFKCDRAPSMQMLTEYFPKATIYGLDINDFSAVNLPRVTIYQGDMEKREDLQRVVDQSGGDFDIIIEDASHASHHQQITLGKLFPQVKPGGMYIIEDLRTQPPELERADAPKTVDLLRRAAVTGDYSSPYIEEGEAAFLRDQVETINFYDGLDVGKALLRNDAMAVLYRKA